MKKKLIYPGIWQTIEKTEFSETKVMKLKSGKSFQNILLYTDAGGFSTMVSFPGDVVFQLGEILGDGYSLDEKGSAV